MNAGPSPEIEAFLQRVIGLDARSIGSSMVTLAVQTRMKARRIKDPGEYGALVAASDAELQALVEEIVVPETWFFRDRQPFVVLSDWAAREWLPAHPYDVLRILSAPCSSGEEPYSIVMALLEAGLSPERFSVEAVDISGVALERARKGLYSRNSFRGQRLEMREKYFRETAKGWQLDEAVRKQVRFRQTNVLHDALGSKDAKLDVIFCRNMLIYFDEASRAGVFSKFAEMLSPEGLLFLGHAEGGIARGLGFEALPLAMAFAFRKMCPTAPAASVLKPRGDAVPKMVKALPPLPAKPAPVRPAAGPVPSRAKAKQAAAPVAPKPSRETLLAEAQKWADAGKFDEARAACEACLREHGPASGTYYLLGLIDDAAGRDGQAEAFYRKALYLEPDHYETLFHLALLAKKGGDAKSFRQLHERANRAQAKSTAKTSAS